MQASETCLYCQAPITQPLRGRKRSFCPGKCKTAYHRQKQREAYEQAQALEVTRLIHINPRDRNAVVRGVMPETSDFLQDVMRRYGLEVARLVAQGIQLEKDAQKKADPVIIEAE